MCAQAIGRGRTTKPRLQAAGVFFVYQRKTAPALDRGLASGLKNECSESKNNGTGKDAKDEKRDDFFTVHASTIAELLPEWVRRAVID